jgi:hypothetical protein
MPRKSQAHKPFAVKIFGHLFQNGDSAGVVFDKVIVCGKDSGDFSLNRERREAYLKFWKFNERDPIYGRTRNQIIADLFVPELAKKIVVEIFKKCLGIIRTN